ncbi:MAG: bacterioferritin [Phenylobacterium sp.]|jgi:bacterioferritin
MKGNQKVVDCLNSLLENELGSIDQYLTHSRMYEDWGLNKLYIQLDHELGEEQIHADLLIKRILFLEGETDLNNRTQANVGTDVQSIMANDLGLEMKCVADLRAGIELCEQEQDYESRAILQKLLSDTESDHVFWLEKQIWLIKNMGISNYIQSQMG